MTTTDLLTHIRSLNSALTEAAGEGGFAMGWHEDIACWNERGIHTPADLDHYALVASACDLSKDAWGYKPSWTYLSGLTNEELEAEIQGCLGAIQDDREARDFDETGRSGTVEAVLEADHSVTEGLMGQLLEGIAA